MTYDICIIGAGVIGCAIARELSRYNCSILLLEKGNDVGLGSTKANSGILHGGYDATHNTNKAFFVYKGNQLYTQWNKELNFGIQRCGSLVLAFNDEQTQALHALKQNGLKNGVPDLSIISQEEILEKEPHLNPEVQAALHCKHSGIVSPYEVALALAENAIENGVQCIFHSNVQALTQSLDTTWVISTEDTEYHATIIINAAGAYSDTVAALTGIHSYTITPRKGNYYVFRRDYHPVNHVIFQVPTKKGKGVLVSPTYHGNMIIGPDAYEVTSKEDTAPDEQKLTIIEETAKHTLPSLDMKMVLRTYAGIRPTLDTIKDFTIDCSKHNCIHLLGIESPGLTSAPAIAQYVIQKITTLLPLALRSDFTATRKAYIPRQIEKEFLPIKEIAQLAKLSVGDPKRIVCQCEQVREQTIHEAMLRAPYPVSIDAIKRRTRASMGYCQGKICRPRIRTLLAHFMKVQEETIDEK